MNKYIETANLIIKTNYNTHNFIYIGDEIYACDRSEFMLNDYFNYFYKCENCGFEVKLTFFPENEEFVEESFIADYCFNVTCNDLILYYFGFSRVLNDDKVEILNCNEHLIKNIIE